jgi:hypothetical protein
VDKEKTGIVIFALIVIGLGVAAIIYPDVMEGADTPPGKSWLEALISWLWGRPGGSVAIIFGILALVLSFRPKRR